ncbi:hypothetical protein AVEN_104061-1 [Araneus ventricosus]|uniref:Uncharacterized protein n=1 Tax=Araneus ventricosus TaxID=182803 RepID=A0A4Y2KE48_ARAVE|nr:hypothetical protein AVEN_104061-1 [Araneus ventricosus]
MKGKFLSFSPELSCQSKHFFSLYVPALAPRAVARASGRLCRHDWVTALELVDKLDAYEDVRGTNRKNSSNGYIKRDIPKTDGKHKLQNSKFRARNEFYLKK